MARFTVIKDESTAQRWLVVNDVGVITGSARTKKAAQEIADRASALAQDVARPAGARGEWPRWP